MTQQKTPVVVISFCLAVYLLLFSPFTTYMCSRPIEEKLGYIPSIKVLKPLSADHKEITAASLVIKVLMYYGGLVSKVHARQIISEPIDFQGMSRILHAAAHLDPYNFDAYYFAQGFLTWDVKQYKVANDLLDYGMQYRSWDWQLPYFAGFNNAFFLKNYAKAAEYYKRAAELGGEELHKHLAGRYLQESGQTELAIAYIDKVLKTAKDPNIIKSYETRLLAYREVFKVEVAIQLYKEKYKMLPKSIDELRMSGALKYMPKDPYGGLFYLDPTGKVFSTSKFSF